MHNMLEDDKTRLGYLSGGTNKRSFLDERLEAMIANEVKLVKEYGDDYFKSGTNKILGRLQRSLGASGEGQRVFTSMRTANNQMGGRYTNEELANMLNIGYENAGLENRFKLPEDLQTREKKQEGGSMGDQMQMIIAREETPNMLPDEQMEDNYLDFIIDEALDEEEESMLMSKLEQDEQLSMLFDKVIEVASEFAGSGPVDGPGSGISDSIPARLSDGEFVFTAKAVKELGSDNLMDLMKTAEMEADERQNMANGGQMEEEETVTLESENEPVRQDIRVTKETLGPQATVQEEEDLVGDEIKKRMMDPSTQSRYVRS